MPNQHSSIDAIRLLGKNRVDEVCDRFERAWKSGETPSLDRFLVEGGFENRSILFEELLLIDLDYRRESGELPHWEDYRRKYPDFIEQIETVRLKGSTLHNSAETIVRNHPTDLQVGACIDRFELLRPLGRGGVGEVWQARDTRLQRLVALKFPRSQDLLGTELHRFLREGKSAAQLRHPHIVTVHEVDRVRDTMYIVSEFIDGENLRERLAHGPLGPQTAAVIGAKTADALQFAHARGIIHRDLKPANVLLDADGEPHITDFGLAKWSNDSSEVTLHGELIGTPAYMSPEQARGEIALVDVRSDIYSLGIVLYEMLTGTRPFAGRRAAALQQTIHDDPVRPRALNRSIPPDLEAICLKAIQKDPRARYASAQDFADDLRRYLNKEPVAARRPRRIQRVWRQVRRHPAVSVGLILGMLAMCSAGAAMFYMRQTHELLGFRDVEISTSPPGARLTIVPIDNVTGAPRPQELRPLGRSPVRVNLAPGDYLLVATLDDQRFHEVYRRVPRMHDTPGVYRHNRWTTAAEGVVSLPSVDIPESTAIDGMARIEAATGQPSESVSRDSAASIQPFYMDPTEVSFREYVRISHRHSYMDQRVRRDNPDAAATVSFDEAMHTAELAGKRLPTEAEYEHAAALISHLDFLTAEMPGESSSSQLEFEAVGRPAVDALPTQPPVIGLYSNVAEWTTSRPPLSARDAPQFAIQGNFAMDYRLVKGGNSEVVAGANLLTTKHRSARDRLAVARFDVRPGLGFRGVRSLRPRERVEDYVEGFERGSESELATTIP